MKLISNISKKALITLILIPLILAAVVFISCLLDKSVNEHQTFYNTFVTSCIAIFFLVPCAGIIAPRRGSFRYRRMTETGFFMLVAAVYAALCLLFIDFSLWFASHDDGTLREVAIAMLIVCGYMIGVVLLSVARANVKLAAEQQKKKMQDEYIEQYKAWFTERYGEDEKTEHVRTGEFENKKYFSEFIRLLCGKYADKLATKSYGEYYDMFDMIAQHRLILFYSYSETEETALNAEVLRLMICRICENLGLDVAVTAEELADELEKSDTEQIRNRRFDGVSTYAHDINAIDRILHRKGFAVISVGYPETITVVREKDVKRLVRIAPVSDAD